MNNAEQDKKNSLERFMHLIRTLNPERIEFERDQVLPEHLGALADFYRSLDDWQQKAAVIDLVQDTIDPATKPIMLDFLYAPEDQAGDYLQICKIIALCHLEGSLNGFTRYYKDRALIEPAIRKVLSKS